MKQLLIVRKDLKMPAGKMAAQVAHASLSAYLQAPDSHQVLWNSTGQAKIILKVNSYIELYEIYSLALAYMLKPALIIDEGRTFFKEPTPTVVGIGPYEDIHLTHFNHLKLY